MQASAVVDTVGSSVKNFSRGDRVAVQPIISCGNCNLCAENKPNICLNAQILGIPPKNGVLSRYFTHPAQLCSKLPLSLKLLEGAMVTRLATSLHCYKRAELNKNSKIVIIGSGIIGLTTLLITKALGVAKVFITDVNDYRLHVAREAGADYILRVNPEDKFSYLKDIVDAALKGEPDVTIDTVQNHSSMKTAPFLTKNGGKVMIMGVPSKSMKPDYTHISIREVDIKGVFGYGNSFSEAIELLETKKVRLDSLYSAKFMLENIFEAFSAIRANFSVNIAIIVNCNDDLISL